MIHVKPANDYANTSRPKIKIVGVGGGGGNAINNMIDDNIDCVDFLCANTDMQSLSLVKTDNCLQLGKEITQGLGAGSNPEIGKRAAEESFDEICSAIEGANIVFITAGMGGGTGTGAAPIIAKATKQMGILSVGVVTKPFQFEGLQRMNIANKGVEAMEEFIDTLIVIPNQNLFRIVNERTPFAEAFKIADSVLSHGVKSITDLVTLPGLINLDFSDVKTAMTNMGRAMMGFGEASGEKRALNAAELAISNPLLEDTCMRGAKGVVVNITGGSDMTLFEIDEAANRIKDELEDSSNIVFGSCINNSITDKIVVSVIAAGIKNNYQADLSNNSLHSLMDNSRKLNHIAHNSIMSSGHDMNQATTRNNKLYNNTFEKIAEESSVQNIDLSSFRKNIRPASETLEESNHHFTDEQLISQDNATTEKQSNQNNKTIKESFLTKLARMTKMDSENEIKDYTSTQSTSQQPNEEVEEIDIPAFLRKQAN